jgi:hypothetical protein
MGLFLKHPIKWGLLVFVLLMILLRPLVQPTTCSDGWRSPSIGRQGACSWHGGVGTNWSAVFVFLLSGAGGLAVGGGLYGVREKRESAERQRLQKLREAEEQAKLDALRAQAKAEGVACPICGCPMRSRKAERSRPTNYVQGCVRYPSCTGTRPFPKQDLGAIRPTSDEERIWETPAGDVAGWEEPPSEEDGWERIE